jgi:hypothetical protein
MPRGGRRPGSGRKFKGVVHQGPVAAAEQQIADRLPGLIDSLFELSEGVLVQSETADGNVRIYRTAPDRQSITYLIDRVMGKPTERHEHSGKDGQPLFPSTMQERLLSDERVAELACDLDECLCRP